MKEHTGKLRPVGRVAIVVSRYNEVVTAKLLQGALDCCRAAGIPEPEVDVIWAEGAFEIPQICLRVGSTGKYAALVALGAVIRGETPHFDYVAGQAARGVQQVALTLGLPVAFGVLTVDNMEQAMARAGGSTGNKGYEACEAAIRSADLCAQFDLDDPK